MKEQKNEGLCLTADQLSEFKGRIIEKSMKKFIISTVATKRKIYEVAQNFVFPWADIEIDEVDDTQDVVWVNVSPDARMRFNFIWEKSNGSNYRLAKVL